MKKYLRSIIFIAISILTFVLIFSVYPKQAKLNDTELFQIRLSNSHYIISKEPLWSDERKAEWVDKSIRKIKSSETRIAYYYGIGYFSSVLFFIIGIILFLSKKNERYSQDTFRQWFSRMDY